MTADKYFELCEQLDKEPVEEEIPVSWEDLPSIAQEALIVFKMLGDRIVADIGYLGKDYTLLPAIMDAQGIEERDLLIEIISWMDRRAIKESASAMKKARDKMKRK